MGFDLTVKIGLGQVSNRLPLPAPCLQSITGGWHVDGGQVGGSLVCILVVIQACICYLLGAWW